MSSHEPVQYAAAFFVNGEARDLSLSYLFPRVCEIGRQSANRQSSKCNSRTGVEHPNLISLLCRLTPVGEYAVVDVEGQHGNGGRMNDALDYGEENWSRLTLTASSAACASALVVSQN